MSAVNLFGLDSTSEVAPGFHHSVGSSFAMRYLSRYSWKVVTRGEFEDYQRNGIHLGLVFEDGARNALGGYAAGKSDAEFAKRQALGILGPPANLNAMLSFAVDYDPAGNASATDSYFEGVAAVFDRHLTGPYGGAEVVARSQQRGFGGLWQTYAWSGGRLVQGAKVYQYSNDHSVGGVGCDFNKCFDDSVFWNYLPTAPDPNHYLWFEAGPFAWKDHAGRPVQLRERDLVQTYDRLRPHPFRNHRQLLELQATLGLVAERIWWAAHTDPARGKAPHLLPPIWNANRRGWRFQQVWHRSKGLVVAT